MITFAVTFVAGGALSYFFSATLYRPVERMVDALPLEKSCRYQSEFQMVASTVQELSKKAKTYENQLSSQSDLLATSFVTRLLKGEICLTPDMAAVSYTHLREIRENSLPFAYGWNVTVTSSPSSKLPVSRPVSSAILFSSPLTNTFTLLVKSMTGF